MNKCSVCNSDNLDAIKTKVSAFLAEKAFDVKFSNGEFIETTLFHCKSCGFAFYEKRLSKEENNKLYEGYRLKNYQKERQKYDVWYTKEINELIGKNDTELKRRKENLTNFISKYAEKIAVALDYGGDKGQFYPEILSNTKKFVYEISGVETVPGVTPINDFKKLKEFNYDFIMCNHVLEHVADVNFEVQKIKELGNGKTYFYFELPFDSPFFASFFDNFKFLFNKYFTLSTIIKHYINMKKFNAFAPMTEHINYFTPKAIESLLINNGFEVIANEVKDIDMLWRKTKIISVMAKIKK